MVLRGEARRHPYDRDLSDLVGELSTQSEEFRPRWARHDVRYHDTGKKRFHHPVVGNLEFGFKVMTLVANPDLTMFAFTAEPGSKSDEALNLLASWTATLAACGRARRLGRGRQQDASRRGDHDRQPAGLSCGVRPQV